MNFDKIYTEHFKGVYQQNRNWGINCRLFRKTRYYHLFIRLMTFHNGALYGIFQLKESNDGKIKLVKVNLRKF